VNYHWDWTIFWDPSPDGVHTYLQTLLLGAIWTLTTAGCAWIIALVLGSLVGVLRTIPFPWVVRLGNAYVELFRNIPLLVQMFLWYFVLPEIVPRGFGNWLKQLPNASFYTAVVALGLYMSARVAEQVRAGTLSLPRGQRLAGLALGLTLPQTYAYVLLPMTFRIILPPLTSELLNTIKNSAVALTIGLMELTARARAMQEFSFQVFEAFTAATIIYILINIVVTFAMRLIEHHVAVPGYLGLKKPAAGHFDVILRSLPYLFYQGMTFTLLLTTLATLGGILVGTLLALMRLSGIPFLAIPAAAYVNLMRSVPFVLMIFWFYFLVPYIGQWVTRSAQPLQVGAFASCLVTFTLFEAAFFCEIMRAGIQSIPRGQVAAAQALGMTYPTTMGYIVLPQAFRNMVPVLLTQTIVLFQDTSLVYVISVTDFLGAASKIAERDGRLVEMYTFAACIYFIISLMASRAVQQMQQRIAIIR
jgi:glutamate/aspartate transport system permease protein